MVRCVSACLNLTTAHMMIGAAVNGTIKVKHSSTCDMSAGCQMR